MERFCRVSQEHPCPISLLHQAHIMPVKISHLQYLFSCPSFFFLQPHWGPPACHPISLPRQDTFSLFLDFSSLHLPVIPTHFYLITVSVYPECCLSLFSNKVQSLPFLLSNQGFPFPHSGKETKQSPLSSLQTEPQKCNRQEILLPFRVENAWEGWNSWTFNCCFAVHVPGTVLQRIIT